MSDANQKMINMHFNIGKYIDEKSEWGNKFINELELELKLDYPNSKGFSARNLRRMKRFYLEYKNDEILPPAVAKLPWTHNNILIALQVHECHVKWRNDIFESTNSIISEEDLKNMIEDSNIFVAKIENNVVGYVIISSREGKKNGYQYRKELDIDAMGVDEEYRNKGIGRQLLEFIKNYARDNNYTDLRLTVNEENKNARYLYETVGFKVKNIAYSIQIK